MSSRPLISFAGPWVYIIFTGVMFGIGGLVTEWLIDQAADPLAITAVAFTATAVTAFFFGRRLLRHQPAEIRPNLWRTGITVGILNAVGPALLFNLGFSHLPASINTLIISLSPVFTAITAHLVSVGDRFTGAKALGLLFSLAGVAVLAGAPAESGGGKPLLGIAFSLTGALLQGISAIWVKRMAERFSPESSLFPMMVGASAVGLLASTIAGHPPLPSAFSPVQWVVLLVMGGTGALTFLSLLKANQMALASKAALLAYVVPLIGVVGGVVILGEPFSALLVIGGLLVVAGVVLVGRSPEGQMATKGYPHSSS